MTDRPATEPRPTKKDYIEAAYQRIQDARYLGMGETAIRVELSTMWEVGEAEAAQGAAPRAEGLEREAAAATPSLPDEWLLSISIMEAARRIDLEMSVGHSWRELAMLTNAILADQYRAAPPVSRSQLSLSPVSASLDALHKTLADALHELMDDEECRFDHHGNCQEHGVSKPCVMQQARDAMRDYGLALARLDKGSATPDEGKGEPR